MGRLEQRGGCVGAVVAPPSASTTPGPLYARTHARPEKGARRGESSLAVGDGKFKTKVELVYIRNKNDFLISRKIPAGGSSITGVSERDVMIAQV